MLKHTGDTSADDIGNNLSFVKQMHALVLFPQKRRIHFFCAPSSHDSSISVSLLKI